jgi:hypothetical protein
MRWLKRKLRNWIDEDRITLADRAIRCSDEPDSECIRFKVFRANGGVVVQTDTYDRRSDRLQNTLHVIVEGQDLGQELGKIITYESLKL